MVGCGPEGTSEFRWPPSQHQLRHFRRSPFRSWRRPNQFRADRRVSTMAAHDNHTEEFWYRGKVTRRRVIGYGATAGALGALMSVPAPWQAAFGQAKPYKIGSEQP